MGSFSPRTSWVPSLSRHKVPDVAPLHAVSTSGEIVVVDGALSVGPVGIEVAIVGALPRLDLALDDSALFGGTVRHSKLLA
jgi:hypothetical protein